MKKGNWINILIILLIIIFVLIVKFWPTPQTSEEIAKCIGKNSVLYVQLGCHACETQKEMFGDNADYLTKIDCTFESEKCSQIETTPTWKIKGELYRGVQSIEKLQELTGC